ncbi:MAG TPA: hypothetical protein VFL36_08350 [Myxococcales bacterium]|nr:hypothetical protein [Myxococcales bacterium]
MRRLLILAGAALAMACASNKQEARLDDSGLARLNEQQMQPVDDARIEQGRAQDALARARANEADARARLEVAKSDRSVADAQLKRAVAERDLLKKQYASADQLAPVEQDIAASQDRIKAADLKLQYIQQMIGVAEAERKVAEAHLLTTQALTEQAKYRAMKENNVPQAASANPGEIDGRVAQAESREAELQKEVAKRRANAVNLYNRWQQADARSRNLARPSNLPVPPPTTGEPTSH